MTSSLRISLPSLAFAALALAPTARAWQDATVPVDFATIGAAVAGATDVDNDGLVEIFVQSGTYAENVRIARSNIELKGDATNKPVIQGDGLAKVVHVETLTSGFLTNVRLANLVVTGGGTFDGVEFSRVDGVRVEGLEIFGNAEGLRWNRGTGGLIRQNLVRNNSHSGMRITVVGGATIEANEARGNFSHGIDVGSFFGGTIQNNNCHGNQSDGLRGRRVLNSTFQGNQLHDNDSNGARLEFCTNLAFLNNLCDANQENGMRTRHTIDCVYGANSFSNNQFWGVRRRDVFGDDFDDATAGDQAPSGNNSFTANGSGDVRND